jgi:hypothetical protein
MKALKLSALAVFISVSSFAQKVEDKAQAAKLQVNLPATTSAIKWEKDTHDFGDLEKGKPVSHQFSFVNTSKETVLLTNVKASCGCTATNYTKTPIKPGEKGMVEATYNAAAPGAFNKTVTVTTSEANASPKVLTIKGKVETEENGQQKSVLLK